MTPAPPVQPSVDPHVHIARNVSLGEGCELQPPCILGKAPREAADGELPLVIGSGAVIRPFTTIYAGSTFGARLQTGQGASIREDNELGDDVSIGTNAVLEFGNRLGSRVRIHSGCFLELVTIEDDVFVGPNVVFTDDPHPMGCPDTKTARVAPSFGVWRASAPIPRYCRASISARARSSAPGLWSSTMYPQASSSSATRRTSSRTSVTSSALRASWTSLSTGHLTGSFPSPLVSWDDSADTGSRVATPRTRRCAKGDAFAVARRARRFRMGTLPIEAAPGA